MQENCERKARFIRRHNFYFDLVLGQLSFNQLLIFTLRLPRGDVVNGELWEIANRRVISELISG
jgi:hypothetical protein